MQKSKQLGKVKETILVGRALRGSCLALAVFALTFLFLPYFIAKANASNLVGATVPWEAVTLTLDPDYGNGNVGDTGHGNVEFGAINPTENSGSNKGTMRVVKKTIGISSTGQYYSVYLNMAGSSTSLNLPSDSNVNIPAIADPTDATKGTWDNPMAFEQAGWGFAVPTGTGTPTSYATNFNEPTTYAGYDSLSGQDLTKTGTGSSVYNTGTWAAVPASGVVTEPIWSSTITTSDTFDVYYAVMVDTNVMAGEYSNSIVYTAVASSQALDKVSNNLSRDTYLVGTGTVETLKLDLTSSTIDFAREKTKIYLVPHSYISAADYDINASIFDSSWNVVGTETGTQSIVDYQKDANHSFAECIPGQTADDFKFESRGLTIKCVMPENVVEGHADGLGSYDFWVSVADYGYNYVSKYQDVDQGNVLVASVVYAGLQSTKDAAGTSPYVTTMQEMTAPVCKNTNMWGNTTSYKSSDASIDLTAVHLYDNSGTNEITTGVDKTGAADTVGTFALEDNRDNKTYLVRRFADGNCWMVQNLDLNLADFAGKTTLTPANTDISYGLASTDAGYREYWNPSASVTEAGYSSFAEWSREMIGTEQAYQFQPTGTSGNSYHWGSKFNEDGEKLYDSNDTDVTNPLVYTRNRTDSSTTAGTEAQTPRNRSKLPGATANTIYAWPDQTYDSGAIIMIGNNTTATAQIGTLRYIENNSRAEIPRSYDNGNAYVTIAPNEAGTTSGQPKTTGSPSQSVGDWYNWYAATAESGTWEMSTESVAGSAKDSICPKGWQLPVNGASNDKSWGKLLTGTYKLADGTTAINSSEAGSRAIRSFPLSLVFSGNYYWYSGGLNSRGTGGLYWSSTPYAATNSRYLYFNSTRVYPQGGDYKTYGLTVRCVAR